MHQPVCVICKKIMKIEKNGVSFFKRINQNSNDFSGEWQGDLWKCPKCGFEILTGFGSEPVKINPSHTDIFDKIDKDERAVVEAKEKE